MKNNIFTVFTTLCVIAPLTVSAADTAVLRETETGCRKISLFNKAPSRLIVSLERKNRSDSRFPGCTITSGEIKDLDVPQSETPLTLLVQIKERPKVSFPIPNEHDTFVFSEPRYGELVMKHYEPLRALIQASRLK